MSKETAVARLWRAVCRKALIDGPLVLLFDVPTNGRTGFAKGFKKWTSVACETGIDSNIL